MEITLKQCPYLREALLICSEDHDASLLKEQTNTQIEIPLALYNKVIPQIERLIWQDGFSEPQLAFYQSLCREFEGHSSSFNKIRHHINIVIPVADRPQHLKMCLQSILTLCDTYCYGGKNKRYNKVSVLIAEDSLKPENISKNKIISHSFNDKGLKTSYFSLQEQKDIISDLTTEQRQQLEGIIGELDLNNLSHKGASIARNISYLKLRQIEKNNKANECLLFYFIDSDQEFKVNLIKDGVEISSYAINYFYYLDKIFSDNNVSVLTGKVVGDPPVSPSVMAANFIGDINRFVTRMAKCKPDAACQFHHHAAVSGSDSAYHDMANLFGFDKKTVYFDYQCTLSGEHNNNDCFSDFNSKLNSFFDGVHLTRKTFYQYQDVLDNIVPARTIYTGNYIFTAEALKYFIPFASLKLRMAGPTMGRLIKNELEQGFVSANLPMLHGRIVAAEGQSEYRPGIKHVSNSVSLAGEFERQFYGDVMLFSVEKLSEQELEYNVEMVTNCVIKIERFLREKYLEKLHLVNKNLENLKIIISDKQAWWNNNSQSSSGVDEVKRFINNIEKNLSGNSPAMNLLTADNAQSKRTTSIINAIMQLDYDKAAWCEVIST